MDKKEEHTGDEFQDKVRSLYLEHHSMLTRYGSSIGLDSDKVQDCIQDLFLWLLKNPDRILAIKNPRVYLLSSLKRNTSHVRKRELQSQHRHEAFFRGTENTPPADQAVIQKESDQASNKQIHQALNDLPPKQQELVYLRFFENLSYSEISLISGQSSQVLRNTLSRALKSLRTKMKVSDKEK